MISIIFLVIVAFLALYFIRRVRVVHQSQAYVVERLGSYYQTWNQGIHFLVPFVDVIVQRLDLRQQVMELKPQAVITKDNVSMTINTIMAVEIVDPKLAVYGVDNLENALEKSVGTALRNVIGELELDQTLSERDQINTRMEEYMESVTGKWGVKVDRVELKDVRPPQEIQQTMERQMKAERERRANVTEAEGKKQAQILNAEADAEAAQKKAEGDAQAKIRLAEADAVATEKRAEGKANAIKKVQKANADGLKFLQENGAVASYIKLQQMDAIQKVADGNATKMIIPSDMQDFVTKSETFSETLKDNDK